MGGTKAGGLGVKWRGLPKIEGLRALTLRRREQSAVFRIVEGDFTHNANLAKGWTDFNEFRLF